MHATGKMSLRARADSTLSGTQQELGTTFLLFWPEDSQSGAYTYNRYTKIDLEQWFGNASNGLFTDKGVLQMAEIIKVYRESLPSLRLIGKRYTDRDRGADGGFSNKWREWFHQGCFKPLEALASLPENEGAYVGCMRCGEEFEYWIGLFFPAGTSAPDGYAYVDIPAGDVGTCWIHGREDTGELYGEKPHNMCMSRIKEAGWQVARNPWFFERYNCPRFTTPDVEGKVVLDYCVSLRGEQ